MWRLYLKRLIKSGMLHGGYHAIYLQHLCNYAAAGMSSPPNTKAEIWKLKMEAWSRRKGYKYTIFFHLDSRFYPKEKDQSLISYLSQSCRNKIPCGVQVYSPNTNRK